MKFKIICWVPVISLILFFLNILFTPIKSYAQDQIIADHTVVDKYSEIPQEYIDIVKTWLVDIAGESHSSGYRIGMNLLEGIDPRFQVSTFDGQIPSVTISELRFGRHASVGEETFYTNSTALSTIKNIISNQHNSGNPFHVIGFGWCWDMTWLNSPGGAVDPVYGVHWAGSSVGGPEGNLRWGLDSGDQALTGNSISMDTYLNAVIEYMQHCTSNGYACKAIFSTGPVDGNEYSENGYQREIKQQYIRNFVLGNSNRILFDYADILCWSNAGGQSTSTWNGHVYPQIHDDNMLDLNGSYTEDGDHIGQRGAVRLAKAMWWMLARMAGWDGGGSIPSPPDVTGATPTNDTTPTWSWVTGGGGNGTFRYKLDSSDLSSGATETTTTSYTPGSALGEGSHTLYVQEKDNINNWSSSGSRTIAIDATPPSAPIVSGATPTADTTPTWSWTSGGGGNSTYRYKLDDSDLNTGATVATAVEYTSTTLFSDGSSHTLYVQERDTAGNWSSSGSRTIVIDTTPPALSGVDCSVTVSGITINGQSEAGATLFFYVNGAVYSQGILNETSWRVSFAGEKILTTSDLFEVIAIDAAGNESTPFEYAFDPEDINNEPSDKNKGGEGGGCFIATAAYGSSLERHVVILREFRDKYLLSTISGKWFVRMYYKFSPPVAEVITRHDGLKIITRWGLAPMVGIVYVAMHTSAMEKAGVLVGIIILTMGCWVCLKWCIGGRP